MSDDRIIGRDAELAELADALASARPGLVLLVGRPATGKGLLMRELRARAAAHPSCAVVPADQFPGADEPWLVVSKQYTVDDFRRALAAASETEPDTEYSTRRDFTLVLIYGYRPEEDFHRWFTREFLPRLTEASPPQIIVVAGSADDVADLEPFAQRRVVLNPLPREAVVAELRTIGAAIADSLQERELQMYADAIVTDPSLLGALRHLLPLTPAGPPAERSAMEG